MDARGSDRLHTQMAAMAALEAAIAHRAAEDVSRAGHEQVAGFCARLRASCVERAERLRSRLTAVSPEAVVPDPVLAPAVIEQLVDADAHGTSGALVGAHALLSQAVLGYAMLVELSFRAADSIEHLGPDNTGDLAWDHLRECAALVREILRTMPYVVADELEADGHDCRCTCPTCGLGVCGCVLAFRRRLDLAFAEAGPVEEWPGITLVRPRAGSPAALAGLQKGDVLEAIDDVTIESIPMLQETISAHPPGDRLQVRVRRGGGRTAETVEVTRS